MGVEITTNYGVKCPHGFYYAFGCGDCTNAHNAREQAEAELREREADALSVLRDLVALPSFVTAASMSDGPLNALYVRARSLVAEHPTDEETR